MGRDVNGRLVPALGTMTLSGAYGPIPAGDAIAVLRHALESGVALLDTADAYGRGDELIAEAMASTSHHRARVVTKVGLVGPPGRRRTCGDPTYLRQACDKSLRRLRCEQVDVLLLHRIDPDVPVEESIGALLGLVQVGKAAEIGLCTDDPTLLRRAATAGNIAYVQTELSLLRTTAVHTLLPVEETTRFGTGGRASPFDWGVVGTP
jgi:aryl-alcohol dehydrogenase-like predicted oxidoreductase